MDYAKVEQLWNEYKDLHIIIGNDERTFHEVFYQDIDELDIWIYKVMEHDRELTDDYEIVLNTLYHYLRNFYFDDYNEGEKWLFKHGDEVLDEENRKKFFHKKASRKILILTYHKNNILSNKNAAEINLLRHFTDYCVF